MPTSAPPRTRTGGKTSPGRAGSTRPSTVAPMRRSGSATRRIGRRVSDASPPRSVSNGRPASRPMSSRMVVPELPQSSAPAAAVQAREADALDARLVARQDDVDTQRAQRRGGRQVVAAPAQARGPRRRRRRAPRTAARGGRSTCRPGTRQVPRSGPDRRTRSVEASSAMSCFTITSRGGQPQRLLSAWSSPAPEARPAAFRPAPPACRRRCAGEGARAIPPRPRSGPRTPARARAA